jgi:hypothetical protein
MPFGFPSLTPTYGLGQQGRTAAGVLISSPRTRIGSQGRIYAWMKQHGKGPQYINFLISILPPGKTPSLNLFNLIS